MHRELAGAKGDAAAVQEVAGQHPLKNSGIPRNSAEEQERWCSAHHLVEVRLNLWCVWWVILGVDIEGSRSVCP